MNALTNYLAANDSTPSIARSQPRTPARATPDSPFLWTASSPLSHRNCTAENASPLTPALAQASNGGNESGENEEGFAPLTPAPRRGVLAWGTSSGPPPAQRRRSREPEDSDTDTFGFGVQGMLSPRSRKKRRGIARSVSLTFGLPEQSLDKFSEVCIAGTRVLSSADVAPARSHLDDHRDVCPPDENRDGPFRGCAPSKAHGKRVQGKYCSHQARPPLTSLPQKTLQERFMICMLSPNLPSYLEGVNDRMQVNGIDNQNFPPLTCVRILWKRNRSSLAYRRLFSTTRRLSRPW